MSRIGKLPVPVPKGVNVTINGSTITARGPKGTLSRTLPAMVSMVMEGETVVVHRVNDSKPARSRHGLSRTLVNNLIVGVSTGFSKKLALVGVGNKAEMKGKTLVLHLGYSHPIEFPVPQGLEIKVEKAVSVTVSGMDREAVGQAAANIRGFRKPDPYKGKGVRYADEVIKLKPGKSGA